MNEWCMTQGTVLRVWGLRGEDWKLQKPLRSSKSFLGAVPNADLGRERRAGWTLRTQLEQVTSPSEPHLTPGPSLTDRSPPLSVSKDEYLADLYHFATKEDSYANYFINVSPRLGSSHPELWSTPEPEATEAPCEPVGEKGLPSRREARLPSLSPVPTAHGDSGRLPSQVSELAGHSPGGAEGEPQPSR